MKFKKSTIIFLSAFVFFLSGMLTFYFWYESKCVKFRDKNMAVQALYLVDSRRGKVLKKEAEQITSIYTTDPDGRFTTLEDLKQFPNLTRLSLTYDTEAMTDEEKADREARQKEEEEEAAEKAAKGTLTSRIIKKIKGNKSKKK